MTLSIIQVEKLLWVAVEKTGVPNYDFKFEDWFACDHPYKLDAPIKAFARMGAAQDYDARHKELKEIGVELVHSPDEYRRTSELPLWYPLLADVTPRSEWFETLPSGRDVDSRFDWPVFVKGERQTNRHSAKQSIIASPAAFDELMVQWRCEPILAWQKVVCREFVQLRPVANAAPGVLQKSKEFRTFCWRSTCVGIGRYWISENYDLNPQEKLIVTQLSEEVARRINVEFLVVDIAQTMDDRWIVIEINDGQDSGYAGISPSGMWRRMLDLMIAGRSDRDASRAQQP